MKEGQEAAKTSHFTTEFGFKSRLDRLVQPFKKVATVSVTESNCAVVDFVVGGMAEGCSC
jgi:hypothetical protein